MSLLHVALTGSVTAALDLAMQAVRDGVAPGRFVTEVLAPAQEEVGQRWHAGRITVLDEHRASTVVDAALAIVEAMVADVPDRGGPRVLVVSAEGEGHALPGRMATAAMRANGVAVDFVGPSIPSLDLQRHLATTRPDVLAVSCSTVAALPGAARCAEAAQAVGVPVVAGGHGFGPAGEWAKALGLPWTNSVRNVVFVAADPETPEIDHEAVRGLDRDAQALAADLAAAVGPSEPVVAEAARHLLGFARAALGLRDGGVLHAHRPWLCGFLGARGVDESVADDLVAALADRAAAVGRLLD